MGFAGRPGTAVEPMCSMDSARAPSASARRRWCSAKRATHASSESATTRRRWSSSSSRTRGPYARRRPLSNSGLLVRLEGQPPDERTDGMLGRKEYTQEELDAATTAVDELLTAYGDLVAALDGDAED